MSFYLLNHLNYFTQEQKDFVPCQDVLKSGRHFAEQCSLIRDLQGISQRVNAAIETVDPEHYAHAVNLRKQIEDKFPFASALNRIDPLVYEGREILYNVSVGLHFDRTDPPLSWVVDCALGYHTGGYFVCPQLGLRIRLEPGDIVMIRGRMVQHRVEDWNGGQRITVPHFTHSATWRMMGLENVVGLKTLVGLDEVSVDYEEDINI